MDTETMAGEKLRPQRDARYGIVVVHSPDRSIVGKTVAIEKRLTVGREDTADLLVRDGKVSRQHATFECRGQLPAFELRDDNSRNGVRLNGKSHQTGPINVGDVVRVGQTLMVFERIDGMLDRGREGTMLGRSRIFAKLCEAVTQVACSDVPVLLIGETGTGKELVAQALHDESHKRGSFLALNCGAMPRDLIESQLFGHQRGAFTGATQDAAGYFERARGGTLFLDEIGELPIDQQPRLLRVLETHEFTPVGSTASLKSDARIVAATNLELASRAEAGVFRRDLYARLAGYVLRLAPLRERRSDIPILVDAWLRELSPERTVSLDADAWEELLLHHWPMNVRELKAVVRRMLIVNTDLDELGKDQARDAIAMAAEPRPQPTSDDPPDEQRPGKGELEAALERCAGNVVHVAESFGKAPKQIYRWIKRYEIDLERYRT